MDTYFSPYVCATGVRNRDDVDTGDPLIDKALAVDGERSRTRSEAHNRELCACVGSTVLIAHNFGGCGSPVIA